MSRAVFLLLFFFTISIPSATSASCGGNCGGCTFIWETITNAAKEIKEEFLEAEKRMSDYYIANALPIEKDIAKLDKRIAKDYGSIEVLQKSILVAREKMALELGKQKKLQYLQGAYK